MRQKSALFLTVGVATVLVFSVSSVVANRGQAAGSDGSAVAVKRKLVGTWRLMSFVLVNEQGAIVGHPYGVDPAGKLTYTRDGNICAHTGQSAAPKAARAANWYTGTFRIDATARAVVHRVQYSSIPDWEGTHLRRRYKFNGPRRLTLSTLPAGPAGEKTYLALRWMKATP
jgi:Lipocalin-like domain